MLKSLLLSERKLVYAILGVKLKCMKDVFLMKLNVICNAEDRFSVLELFCRANHVRASMHKITSLELLRTLMLCLLQLSKRRESKATDAEKLLLSERKLVYAILGVKLKYERCLFLMKLNVICNAEDRFSCFRDFAAQVI